MLKLTLSPRRVRSLALLALALLLAGCRAAPAATPTPPLPASPDPASEIVGTPAPGVTSLAPGQIAPGDAGGGQTGQTPLDLAVRILSQATGLRPDQISPVDAIRVEWPDGSLGCPQPGVVYVQMITPGYLVTLVGEGVEYRVHMDDAGGGVVCFSDEGDLGAGPNVDPIAEEFIRQARFDLASRLNVALEAIELVSSEAVEWPDSRLGCGDSGDAGATVITAGYRIVLAHGGQQYFYHTSYDQLLFCENPLP